MQRKVVQSVSHIRFPSKECNEIWTLTNYWVKVLGIPMEQDVTQYHVIDNYITISYISFCFSNKNYFLSIIDMGRNSEFWDPNSFKRTICILTGNSLFLSYWNSYQKAALEESETQIKDFLLLYIFRPMAVMPALLSC